LDGHHQFLDYLCSGLEVEDAAPLAEAGVDPLPKLKR
jgi:hypothetical protein